MSQAAAVRAGLAANLAPLVSGGTLGQASPYALSNPTPPCAFITDGEITYDAAMHRGGDWLSYLVVVLVADTVDVDSQQLLDQLRDPSGVKALIESDPTLAGAADDLRVTKASPSRLYERAGLPAALGAEWTVQILATG